MPDGYEIFRTNPTRGADTPFVRKVRAKKVRLGPILSPEQILAANTVEKERQKVQAAMRGPQSYGQAVLKEATQFHVPRVEDAIRRWKG